MREVEEATISVEESRRGKGCQSENMSDDIRTMAQGTEEEENPVLEEHLAHLEQAEDKPL